MPAAPGGRRSAPARLVLPAARAVPPPVATPLRAAASSARLRGSGSPCRFPHGRGRRARAARGGARDPPGGVPVELDRRLPDRVAELPVLLAPVFGGVEFLRHAEVALPPGRKADVA